MGKSSSIKTQIPLHKPQWDRWSYRIGCPVWGCRNWSDQVYPAGTPADDFLTWYSCAFPTVEGNSTFYAVPPKSTFEKWRDTSADTFQFSFKFPRRVSHDLRLQRCETELAEWLDRLSVLVDSNRLGPTFLQLAPSFSFAYFPQLSSFLRQLPSNWPWAVDSPANCSLHDLATIAFRGHISISHCGPNIEAERFAKAGYFGVSFLGQSFPRDRKKKRLTNRVDRCIWRIEFSELAHFLPYFEGLVFVRIESDEFTIFPFNVPTFGLPSEKRFSHRFSSF